MRRMPHQEADRATICEPQEWFRSLGFDLHENFWDVYAIYHTLADYDSGYGYDIERTGEVVSIRPYDEVYPILKTTDQGLLALIGHLDSLYGDSGGVDAYDAYLHAMEKDD